MTSRTTFILRLAVLTVAFLFPLNVMAERPEAKETSEVSRVKIYSEARTYSEYLGRENLSKTQTAARTEMLRANPDLARMWEARKGRPENEWKPEELARFSRAFGETMNSAEGRAELLSTSKSLTQGSNGKPAAIESWKIDGMSDNKVREMARDIFASREVTLTTAESKLKGKVPVARINRLLGSGGAITRLERDSVYTDLKDTAGKAKAVDDIVNLEVRAARLEDEARAAEKAKDPRAPEMLRAVEAIRHTMEVTSDKLYLAQLDAMTKKFQDTGMKDQGMLDMVQGLGVVADAKEAAQATTAEAFDAAVKKFAADIVGPEKAGDPAAMAKAIADVKKSEADALPEAKALAEATGLKIDVKGAETFTDLMAKVDAELTKARAEGKDKDRIEKLEQLKADLEGMRLVAILKANPRFELMDPAAKAQMITCSLKGNKTPDANKSLAAALQFAKVPAAALLVAIGVLAPSDAKANDPKVATKAECLSAAQELNKGVKSVFGTDLPEKGTVPSSGRPGFSAPVNVPHIEGLPKKK